MGNIVGQMLANGLSSLSPAQIKIRQEYHHWKDTKQCTLQPSFSQHGFRINAHKHPPGLTHVVRLT